MQTLTHQIANEMPFDRGRPVRPNEGQRSRSPGPGDKEINVPEDFFTHFPLPENMSLQFLQFNKNEGGFIEEIKCQNNINVHPSSHHDEHVHKNGQMDSYEQSYLIPFVGDRFDSRCAIVVNGHATIATIDSGCRSLWCSSAR